MGHANSGNPVVEVTASRSQGFVPITVIIEVLMAKVSSQNSSS